MVCQAVAWGPTDHEGPVHMLRTGPRARPRPRPGRTCVRRWPSWWRCGTSSPRSRAGSRAGAGSGRAARCEAVSELEVGLHGLARLGEVLVDHLGELVERAEVRGADGRLGGGGLDEALGAVGDGDEDLLGVLERGVSLVGEVVGEVSVGAHDGHSFRGWRSKSLGECPSVRCVPSISAVHGAVCQAVCCICRASPPGIAHLGVRCRPCVAPRVASSCRTRPTRRRSE